MAKGPSRSAFAVCHGRRIMRGWTEPRRRRPARRTPTPERLEDRLVLSPGGGAPKPPPPPPPPTAPADPAIAFVAQSGTGARPAYDLMVMNADGTNRTAIWRAPAGFAMFRPTWSP